MVAVAPVVVVGATVVVVAAVDGVVAMGGFVAPTSPTLGAVDDVDPVEFPPLQAARNVATSATSTARDRRTRCVTPLPCRRSVRRVRPERPST